MFTERLYYSDSYLTAFDAEVVDFSDDGKIVYLDRTAFYPSSGGQPNDLGTLNGERVLDVLDQDSRIAHVLSRPIQAGRVRGIVDWDRRFSHMQQHTGQHLLSAVFQELLGAPTLSFHLGPEVSTVEIGAKSLIDKQLEDVEARANQIVWEARPVSIQFEDASTAEGLRKASARTGTLRIIDIAGFDRSACGGTHVRSTAEIGAIQIRGLEKIRGNVRIEFACGMRAVRAARADFRLLSEVSRTVALPPLELPAAIQGMRDRLRDSEKETAKLRGELARQEGLSLYASTPEGAGGLRRAFLSRPVLDETVRACATAFVTGKRAIALAAAEQGGAVLLAASSDSDIDAGRTLKACFARHGGRGGGSAQLAQGSFDNPEMLSYLREELGFRGN